MSLTGTIAAMEPLRHTPAGIPLLAFRLAHTSQQVEAGVQRQVECEVSCVALAQAATELARVRTGSELTVNGFLNRRNRMSAQLVLHATSTEIVRK